jgi:AraC-like DNA-binding protein
MGNLSPDAQAAVTRMQGYIRAHLKEPITAQKLAAAAGYSPYHAARLFKAETGFSPFEYIRLERLTASARALRGGKSKVLDIALDFVFDSPEGFTRAFSSAFGITPKKYASARPSGWLIPFSYSNRPKSKSEESDMTKAHFIFTQIIERPARKLILLRSKKADDYFAYCEEYGCGSPGNPSPWEILCGIKEALYEPVGLWLQGSMRPEGTGFYAHGVEVPANYAGPLPERFEVIDLPPCKLIVFQGEPFDDADFETAVGRCMEHIEKFNPEVYGYRYAPELAPRMQLEPVGWRGYIEMLPVVEIK